MDPEVNKIRARISESAWPKFLESMQITGLRGWHGQEIRFPFPVCVISGENGCGKSTVLKAAASAYVHPDDPTETYYPSSFFPDTAWEHVEDVELIYKIKEGDRKSEFKIKKTKKNWHYPKPRSSRVVRWQDVSRTLPLDATAGYAFQAKRTATEVSANQLDQQTIKYYSKIMGREYVEAKFAKSDLDEKRSVGVVRIGDVAISQFHQGAGEDATLDLLAYLQTIPDTSLLIIDEIEASLHPYAQRRLIHYLLWLSRIGQIQIILSSHSKCVLEELPPEARIFLQRSVSGVEVFYGITPEFALSRMDTISHPEANLYCEDEEAVILIQEILRFKNFDIRRVKIVAIGPANEVKVIGRLSQNPDLNLGSKGCGILDADQQISDGCVKFYGDSAPEEQVFNDIKNSDEAKTNLASRLTKSTEEIIAVFERTTVDTDHHNWITEAARLLGHEEKFLWVTMCQIWVANCVPTTNLDTIIADIERKISS
jgi:predicted ATPase